MTTHGIDGAEQTIEDLKNIIKTLQEENSNFKKLKNDNLWLQNGEPDPLDRAYFCERTDLTLGEFTDDQLANAVFMYGNVTPDINDVISGKAKMPIVYLTAAKDRIRWLSRRLILLEKMVTK